ncbi:MAG: NTP transferase domain-containing protein [Pseudobdellovibrionaceae bacterium]|nr:NTP transferase domain-containing protein [Bdellovibrionales bacterium]USN46681.1 MAG: NTP transferase domain-containing protein [Pseudobdellovibrionaceae bacterium]
MNAMILAAGFGNRFLPHTGLMAKPALPFLNQPLISYTHYYLEQLSVDKIVVNTHHLPYTVKAAVESLKSKSPVVFTEEKPNILGSGGGIGFAKGPLENGEAFLVANGDEVLLFQHDRGFSPLVEAHKVSKPLITHLVCENPEVGKTLNGVWVDEQGWVRGYGRKAPEPGLKGFHFLGVHVMEPKVFRYIPEGESNILYDVAVRAIEAGEKIAVHVEENPQWFETGNLDSYLEATTKCLSHLVNQSVYGTGLKNILDRYQKNYHVEAAAGTQVFYSENVHVADDAAFVGSVVLGHDCHVQAASTIESSVVAAHVKVAEGQHRKNELIL